MTLRQLDVLGHESDLVRLTSSQPSSNSASNFSIFFAMVRLLCEMGTCQD